MSARTIANKIGTNGGQTRGSAPTEGDSTLRSPLLRGGGVRGGEARGGSDEGSVATGEAEQAMLDL